MNPQNVRNAEFESVRRGFDPAAVNRFLAEVADSLEKAQNHATAMEARARAAVQRAQALAESAAEPAATPDEAETISRTLLLAQRTADATIAEAETEAEAVRSAATEEATKELDAARELAKQMSESAKADAEAAYAAQRATLEAELEEMTASRDLLAADVQALDGFLATQRERVRDAATTLLDLTERTPGGLAAMLAPVLSSTAAADVADPPAEGIDVDVADVAPDETAAAADGDDDTGAQTVSAGDAPDPIEAAPADSSDELQIVTDLDQQRPGDPTPVDPAASRSDLHFDFDDDS